MTDIPIPDKAIEALAESLWERTRHALSVRWKRLGAMDREARDAKLRGAHHDLQAAAPTLYATWVGGELERLAVECEVRADDRERQGREDITAEDAYLEVAAVLRQRAATLRGGDGG